MRIAFIIFCFLLVQAFGLILFAALHQFSTDLVYRIVLSLMFGSQFGLCVGIALEKIKEKGENK